MGETDLVPPKPPAAKEEGEDKAKKGFFKSVFKKKEKVEDNLELPSSNELNNDKQNSSKEIDEISKLIDDTINDIQKLQTNNTSNNASPKTEKLEEPKKIIEAVPPKKEDVNVEKEVKIPGINSPASDSKAVKVEKPIIQELSEPKKIQVSKKVIPVVKKKVVTKKETSKPQKKNYDLPAFEKKNVQTISKKVTVTTETKIKDLEKELSMIKEPRANSPFLFNNGKKAFTAKELLSNLKTANNSDWNHHVSDKNNDFANWIKTELKNPKLAEEFSKYFMKNDAINALEKSLPKQSNPVQIKALEKKLYALKQEQLKENYQKKLSQQPKDFFKINEKTVKDLISLEKSIKNISQKEFSEYVSTNKESFTKWLEYLAKGYKTDIKKLDIRYKELSKKVLNEVNSKVDARVKAAKKELDNASSKLKLTKSEVDRLTKNKNSMLLEQKTLADKKKNLMAEISKVTAEHKQVHELKEKTQKEKDILHNEIANARLNLKNEKLEHAKTLKEAKAAAKIELNALSKEARELKSKIVAEENKIKKQQEALKKQQELVEKRDQESKKREIAVTKREDGFKAEKERIERLVKNFEEREKEIELQKSELEVAGFQKYLDAKLKELHPSETKVSVFDTGVEEAKNFINSNDLEAAKRKYLSLKQQFDSSGLSGSEKDRVYNLLRELYDDIMLSVN